MLRSNILKRILFLLPVLLLAIAVMAQPAPAQQVPDMAGVMRSNGKIYVVVAVVLTILIGVFLYLVRLERKIGRLEKEH